MSDNRFNEEDYFYTEEEVEKVVDFYDNNIIHDTGFDLKLGGTWKKLLDLTILKNGLYEKGTREKDPIYNDENSPLQIHCFGCSWTYGWGLEQEETFPHLLGGMNKASIHNYGVGRAGLDYTMKRLSKVYNHYNHDKNKNFFYVITIPHTFRKMYFEDTGRARRSWSKEMAIEQNNYNHYLNFYHHYSMINNFVGRDKIIWGTWDLDLPKDNIDIVFEKVDLAKDDSHPGIESHKMYANKVNKIIKERLSETN